MAGGTAMVGTAEGAGTGEAGAGMAGAGTAAGVAVCSSECHRSTHRLRCITRRITIHRHTIRRRLTRTAINETHCVHIPEIACAGRDTWFLYADAAADVNSAWMN